MSYDFFLKEKERLLMNGSFEKRKTSRPNTFLKGAICACCTWTSWWVTGTFKKSMYNMKARLASLGSYFWYLKTNFRIKLQRFKIQAIPFGVNYRKKFGDAKNIYSSVVYMFHHTIHHIYQGPGPVAPVTQKYSISIFFVATQSPEITFAWKSNVRLLWHSEIYQYLQITGTISFNNFRCDDISNSNVQQWSLGCLLKIRLWSLG